MKMEKNVQHLPPKENSLFKRILRCYEQKQYKNGLKFAKLILANFPDHGETLAMKGLTLNCIGRKEEAYNFVRQGLRNNLTSHVCWHVYGLLQRSDKKYEEAIKCYRNALKWDKDNLQILRDLSLLQIQMRDLEGYKETRYKLFDLRPTQRASWIGYAMSFHLLKDYDMALRIIEEFRKTIQKITYDYEYSELLLYQNMVLKESNRINEALEHLHNYQSNICDKVTLQELKGELLMASDRNEEASEVYRTLIARNPENRNYYLQLEGAMNLQTEEEKLKLYKDMKLKYPKAHVPRRLPLNYATGERLEEILDPYLRAALQKGVPPLFTDVRGLYKFPEKVKIIEKLMIGYLKSLHETGYLSDKDKDYKEPASILYGLMYLAQHYSYLGDTAEALKLLQAALDHTPTLIELYILKGKILKHAGDYIGAYEALQEAQSLDTADRYVNSKAASYLLAAGKVAEAEEMCSKFTREGVSAMENLNEMQCMWFQTECADAFFRLKQYGQSLKKCHEIDRHFTEIIEDQFDFHTYCMRKMTLRSYLELLRLEDILRNNRFYWEAARIAIKIYIRLHDHPITDSDTNNIDTSNMTPAEVKKFRAKQRKAQKKAEQIRLEEKRKEEKKAEHHHKQRQKNYQSEDHENSPAEDLIPNKLERPVDPLGEAIHFLQPLQNLASERIQTHIFAFEIYFRKNKPLLMLQSLKRAISIESTNPELHTCLVRFLKYRLDKSEEISGPVADVIEKELSNHLKTLDPVQINEDYLNKFQNSFPHRLQAARGMMLLDSVQRERSLSIATNVGSHLSERTLEVCMLALEWLESPEMSASPEEISHYKAACHQIFSHAIAFKSSEQSNPETPSVNSASPTPPLNSNNCVTTNHHNHVDDTTLS